MAIVKSIKKSIYNLLHLVGLSDSTYKMKKERLQNNRQELRETDIILLSYPRSGNSWNRHLIADLMLQHHGIATGPLFPEDFEKIIPSIYSQDLTKTKDERLQLPYRVIKSHEHCDAKNRKFIYIFRQPEDLLVSWYYFQMNHPQETPEKEKQNRQYYETLGLNQFCLDTVDEWIQHLQEAIQRQQADTHISCWICYEKLKQNTVNTLQSVVQFLRLNVTPENIQKAIENQSFEKRIQVIKATEQEKQLSYNLRYGKVGKNRQELDPKTLNIIKNKTDKIYQQAYNLM